MTDRPAEPATAAGRVFLANEVYDRFDSAIDDSFIWPPESELLDAILGIEAEAGAATIQAEREALVDAFMAEEISEGHYRWQIEDIVDRALGLDA